MAAQPTLKGMLAWTLAALVLLAAVGLYVVMRVEPATVGSEDVIAVPQNPAPTPLMKPKTVQ